MPKVRGSDYLSPPLERGKAWCRWIVTRSGLDLTKYGCYAYDKTRAPFVGFDKTVRLKPHQFLLVASQNIMHRDATVVVADDNADGAETDRTNLLSYSYACLACDKDGQIQEIDERALLEATENALLRYLRETLNNAELYQRHVQHAKRNVPYMLALFCHYYYTQNQHIDIAGDTTVFETEDDPKPIESAGEIMQKGRRRMIDVQVPGKTYLPDGSIDEFAD